jgi:lysophospholipase L1-like esterase
MKRPFRTLLCLAATAVGLTVLSAPANAAAANYVALGDSYSSGVGTGGTYSGGGCKRSTNAYPQLWANTHAPSSFSFVACSGAKTGDLLNNQLGTLNSGTTLVTVTIGGNDAGFTDVITTCTLGSDSTCVNRVNQAKTFVNNELPAKLNSVYSAIRQRSPSARVVVLGYPRFYKVPGSCNVGLSDTKRSAINSGADALAAVTASRASAAGFTFVDIRGAWTGHEICSGDWWLNSLTWPVDESYHPNRNGQARGYLPALNGITG